MCKTQRAQSSSIEVPLYEEQFMRVFIGHVDVQSVLATLQLPFFSDDYAPTKSRSCVVVEDDDLCAAADCNALAVVPVRQPLAPLNQNVMNRSNSNMSITSMRSNNTSLENMSVSHRSEHSSQTQVDVDELDECMLVETSSLASSRKDKRWTAAALRNLVQADYENMQPAQCVFVATKASSALKQQTQRTQVVQKQLRSLKRTNKLQAEALVKKQRLLEAARSASSLEIVRVGKTEKRLSVPSIFAVGIRRNLSNIASSDFGATILQNISHQRVCSAEVRTAAAALCRMRDACLSVVSVVQASGADLESQAPEPDQLGDTEWDLSTISFRCDATNSSIWRPEKLHVLDADFAWICSHSAVKRFDAAAAIQGVSCLCRPELETSTCVMSVYIVRCSDSAPNYVHTHDTC